MGDRYDVLPGVPHRATPLDGKKYRGSSWCKVSVKRIFIWGGHDLQISGLGHRLTSAAGLTNAFNPS